jgi:hypothetical protein
MSPSTIALDALEAFDRETAPLGLYACEESGNRPEPAPRLQLEWARIAQSLSAAGCRVQTGQIRRRPRAPFNASEVVDFSLPDRGRARMRMIRTSKVKVRRFGSAYRMDLHVKYAERWNELRMDRLLSDLWKPSTLAYDRHDLRLLLFIGFAAEARPFHQELTRLEREVDWQRHAASYETRCWSDRFERGFGVRLCCWSHPGAGQ